MHFTSTARLMNIQRHDKLHCDSTLRVAAPRMNLIQVNRLSPQLYTVSNTKPVCSPVACVIFEQQSAAGTGRAAGGCRPRARRRTCCSRTRRARGGSPSTAPRGARSRYCPVPLAPGERGPHTGRLLSRNPATWAQNFLVGIRRAPILPTRVAGAHAQLVRSSCYHWPKNAAKMTSFSKSYRCLAGYRHP